MGALLIVPLIIQTIVLLGLFGALIYVIVVQIEKKKKENFEDRDN